MYIIKNSLRNIKRMFSRNLIIGIIITFTTLSACISLTVEKSGNDLISYYEDTNPVEVSFQVPRTRESMMGAGTTNEVEALTIDDIEKYGSSDLVSSYYYTMESMLNSDEVLPYSESEEDSNDESTDTDQMTGMRNPGMNMEIGDFRIIAYNDSSFNEEFISGDKKIIEGEMVHEDSSDNEIVISEQVALNNDILINDTVTFTTLDDVTKEFIVVGIYEDNTVETDSNIMNLNALDSSNVIYTTISTMESIVSDSNNDFRNMSGGLISRFYLNSVSDIDAFYEEALSLGLDENYEISSNEDEITSKLTPIEQISKFSSMFVIVVIIVGIIILSVINLLNIKERKYEIGVLRSIGMSKTKVAISLLTETFIVASVSLIIGISLSFILSQPVTDYMLEEQINTTITEAENASMNFGNERMGQQMMDKFNQSMGNGDVEYISDLTVTVDSNIILMVIAYTIILVLFSSLLAILNINKYEPNKILQSRG